ncbi:MAG: 5-formyltetrahydrofolate cyclo-ligase [bacterium]|jgi:5-formyltetrahydrofolate cyclo-ligase|nr:5-formyltetrahydrofolate cyclo-ligase [bacterium]
MAADDESLVAHKQEVREAAQAARREQTDKDGLSRLIVDTVTQLPSYREAACVMWYIDVRSEVRTRHALPAAIDSGKKVVVPFCVDGELELFHLESMSELSEGMYTILEPREELRGVAAKRVRSNDPDIVLVPGVAFDRQGARVGHGKGYYDKLLGNVRSDASLIALAFECQVVDSVPLQTHDIRMDMVVTENHVYPGKQRTIN